jgi:hypothetical protein
MGSAIEVAKWLWQKGLKGRCCRVARVPWCWRSAPDMERAVERSSRIEHPSPARLRKSPPIGAGGSDPATHRDGSDGSVESCAAGRKTGQGGMFYMLCPTLCFTRHRREMNLP